MLYNCAFAAAVAAAAAAVDVVVMVDHGLSIVLRTVYMYVVVLIYISIVYPESTCEKNPDGRADPSLAVRCNGKRTISGDEEGEERERERERE